MIFSRLPLFFLAGTGLAMAGAGTAAIATAGAVSDTTLAEYTIKHQVQVVMRLGKNVITADLTGPQLALVSPQYEMTAPKIHVVAAKGGTPARYKATEANATGGVRIVARNPEAHQTTTLTCDRAVYQATTNPKDRGHIDLIGHVHSETTDPALVGPLIQQSERGTITFVDADTTDIKLDSADITGTLIEPQQKKPTDKPGKKATP